jgi:divalent metal cation (Fe/Co/Zn/Cd) transporter
VHDDFILKVREIAKNVGGVIDTEKCFIRKTGMKYHIDLHIIVDGNISVTEGHAISHKLKDKLQDELPEVSNILIHVEPND